MKKTSVLLSPDQGITLLLAHKIAAAARQMKAVVILQTSGRFADARNILSILAMCATMGANIEVEAYGPDAAYAARTFEQIFSTERSNAALGNDAGALARMS